ncbi:hypothetical protein GCK32_018292 [Trichostrongylus colubriformis]|uniref:Uncharacterized protein n=1 Tax=Trichostrongylus colubriformis TaxID=6319 RepID=A0AAN8FG14_TRICO
MDHVGHSKKTDSPSSRAKGRSGSEILCIVKQKYGSDSRICHITSSDIAYGSVITTATVLNHPALDNIDIDLAGPFRTIGIAKEKHKR